MREDRRAAQRARAEWRVQVETPDGAFIRGRVVDISASGARITVEQGIPVGTDVRLMMTLPGTADRVEVVAVDGRVVRADEDAIAVDIVGVGSSLPERAARRVRPRLDTWEARRRSPRVHLPVMVTLRHAGGALVPAETVDLSAFGARVTTGLALRPGERVDVLLPPDGDTEPQSLHAVVWEIDERGAVLVFVNVAPGEFERLGRFVAALLEEPS
ncbi:MAG TPA: PilZ domain-containing protein [Methylomirabilota bacterium]|nr:PilZ domain-containing protein [Methylomirabilota bacterium]